MRTRMTMKTHNEKEETMIGAMAGDIIGSVYEQAPHKSKEFELFHPACQYTDDTVLTVAVADAAMTGGSYRDTLIIWGRRHPHVGYGRGFAKWLRRSEPVDMESRGNGAAMRVASVAYLFESEGEVLEEARRSARCTHGHAEGIRGAQAVALAIWLARNGECMAIIRCRIEEMFGYDLQRSIDAIRPGYRFDSTADGSVPEAIVAFLDSDSWEDAVRNAVSLGGDSDTQACIAGAIAEAYYGGVPDDVRAKVLGMLSGEMREVVDAFYSVAPHPQGRGVPGPQICPDPDLVYEQALSEAYRYSMLRYRDESLRGKEPEMNRDERRELGMRALRIIRQLIPASRAALYDITQAEWSGSFDGLVSAMLRIPALEAEVERINADEFGLGLLRCRPKRADRTQPEAYRKRWTGYMAKMYEGFEDEIMKKLQWWFAAPPSITGDELRHLPEFAMLLEAVKKELGDGAGERSRQFGQDGVRRGIVEHLILEKIDGILSMDDFGAGSQGEVKMLKGRLVLHTFSWATAMHWLSRLAAYRKQFGDFPQWAHDYHPLQRIDLIELALETGLALPERFDERGKALSPALMAFEAILSGRGEN